MNPIQVSIPEELSKTECIKPKPKGFIIEMAKLSPRKPGDIFTSSPVINSKRSDMLYSCTFLSMIKMDYKLSEILTSKDIIFERNFDANFRIVSTNVEFKSKVFYQQVKLILEPNRLLAFRHVLNTPHTKNANDQNDKLKPSHQEIEDTYNPLVVLNFDQVTAACGLCPKSLKFEIYVLGCSMTFKFRVIGQELYQRLLIYLNYFINNSLGHKTNLFGVSLRKDFHQLYYITEREFTEKARTGDLLIFRGFECPAKCQRCFTRAHYDHLALLHKRESGLFVYESTSKDGVMLRSWREFTAYLWNLLYDKMAYRELIIKLEGRQKEMFEAELHKNTEDFIKETQKMKYVISCCALCCGSKEEYEKNNQWKKSKGYFCSQLVAAAYIRCGIMPLTMGTGRYLPGHFSQSKMTKLNDNFILGPESIIEFSASI